MTIPKMLSVFGAFRVLRRRAVDVGQPGLNVWVDAGERAAHGVSSGIASAAHAAETDDLEAQKELDAGLAGLADGRADAPDLEHLLRAKRLLRRSAELDHDIGEAVQS